MRQSAKRQRTPEVLETVEIQRLAQELNSCFRLMVILDVTTGLRRGELFALKWSDIDFSNLLLDVQRSIYLGKVGNCNTEASRKPVPLDKRVAADICLGKRPANTGKQTTGYLQALTRMGDVRFGRMLFCKKSSDLLRCGLESGKWSDGTHFGAPIPRF